MQDITDASQRKIEEFEEDKRRRYEQRIQDSKQLGFVREDEEELLYQALLKRAASEKRKLEGQQHFVRIPTKKFVGEKVVNMHFGTSTYKKLVKPVPKITVEGKSDERTKTRTHMLYTKPAVQTGSSNRFSPRVQNKTVRIVQKFTP